MSIAQRNVVQLRIDPDDRALIDRAAAALGMNRTQFMLAAARREAEEAVLDQQHIMLSPEDFHALCNYLEQETPPPAALSALLKQPKPWTEDK